MARVHALTEHLIRIGETDGVSFVEHTEMGLGSLFRTRDKLTERGSLMNILGEFHGMVAVLDSCFFKR